MKVNRGVSSLLVVALSLGSAWAAPGFSWLQLGGSARAVGVGQAVTAFSEGSGSLLGNPAGAAWGLHSDLTATHSTWLESMTIDTLAFTTPTTFGTVGGGGLWFSTPELERRGSNRERLGNFSAASWTAWISYAVKFDQTWAFGLNLKHFSETLDDLSATGLAVDLGFQAQPDGWPIRLGFLLQHAGPPVTFLSEATTLPTRLSVGMVLPIMAGFEVAADLQSNLTASGGWNLRLGTEVAAWGPLALRTGYTVTGSEGSNLSESLPLPAGWVGGLGVTFEQFTLDYAVLPVAPFGLTHRFTVKGGWE